MSVDKSQIGEILQIILRYVPPNLILALLHELCSVQAYQKNKSYRDTITLLINEHRKGENP